MHEISLTKRTIKIFAQDPLFNDRDKELLQSLDVEVLEHPAAFKIVTWTSFVYAPFFAPGDWPLGVPDLGSLAVLGVPVDKVDQEPRADLQHLRDDIFTLRNGFLEWPQVRWPAPEGKPGALEGMILYYQLNAGEPLSIGSD